MLTGKVIRYNARLTAQGYTQDYGQDFDEVFAALANAPTAYLYGRRDQQIFTWNRSCWNEDRMPTKEESLWT